MPNDAMLIQALERYHEARRRADEAFREYGEIELAAAVEGQEAEAALAPLMPLPDPETPFAPYLAIAYRGFLYAAARNGPDVRVVRIKVLRDLDADLPADAAADDA